jgi:putative PIN family toxin of toxin-antitoxin system
MSMRAVLDTNVLVSGLVTEGGAPQRILDAWLEGRFTLVTSLYLLEELVHVLTYPRIVQRLRVEEEELLAFLDALVSKAEIVSGRLCLLGVTRDPKDDAVVACAQEGEADYIVSGDQDLLVLEKYGDVQIISPREFLEILERDGADSLTPNPTG